jgi:hypothetical protein
MSELRLRARTVSEIVDTAFALYRQHAAQYILVTAVAFSPLLILQLLLPDSMQPSPGNLGVSVYGTAVASWLTYSLMSAVLVKLASQTYLGGQPNLGETWREVAPQIPAILVASLLKAVLLFVGLFAFIVGAFYVVARFFAVSTAIVLEDKGPWEAFGRSSELSRGRKRFILNALLLVYIIYTILSYGVLGLVGLIGNPIVAIVGSSVFTIVAYPLIGLTEMLLYYDARIRNEGFDIEQMAAAIDARPATT